MNILCKTFLLSLKEEKEDRPKRSDEGCATCYYCRWTLGGQHEDLNDLGIENVSVGQGGFSSASTEENMFIW